MLRCGGLWVWCRCCQSGLRELLASRGVTVDESVLRLLEASATEEKVQAVMDRFPQAYWRLKLAIALVAERMKGPKSFW